MRVTLVSGLVPVFAACLFHGASHNFCPWLITTCLCCTCLDWICSEIASESVPPSPENKSAMDTKNIATRFIVVYWTCTFTFSELEDKNIWGGANPTNWQVTLTVYWITYAWLNNFWVGQTPFPSISTPMHFCTRQSSYIVCLYRYVSPLRMSDWRSYEYLHEQLA